jgi:hypothetical protein
VTSHAQYISPWRHPLSRQQPVKDPGLNKKTAHGLERPSEFRSVGYNAPKDQKKEKQKSPERQVVPAFHHLISPLSSPLCASLLHLHATRSLLEPTDPVNFQANVKIRTAIRAPSATLPSPLEPSSLLHALLIERRLVSELHEN